MCASQVAITSNGNSSSKHTNTNTASTSSTSTSSSSGQQHHPSSNSHKDGHSRALKDAAGRRAKKVHFYQNGAPYAPRLTVSIGPRDFSTLEQLAAYLTTEKAPEALLGGVQYVFTTTGRRVTTLDELEHDQEYVLSGGRTFHAHPYGLLKSNAPRISHISGRYKLLREDDLRLLRPLSSKYNNVYATVNGNSAYPSTRIPHYQNSSNHPHPHPTSNSKDADSRLVTIVNNQNHHISSRVILNLRSPKSFDTMLRDLGQAVRMTVPRRMFTSSGLEVRSVSHLKHDLAHVDLFYVDSERGQERLQLLTKFHSLESIEKFLESSVQRLNDLSRADYHHPLGTSSSNVDLREHHHQNHHHNFGLGGPHSSHLPNPWETERKQQQQQQTWQKSNDVATYQINSTPQPKPLKRTGSKKSSTHIPTHSSSNSKSSKQQKSHNTLETGEPVPSKIPTIVPPPLPPPAQLVPEKKVDLQRHRSISQSRESLRKSTVAAAEKEEERLLEANKVSFSLEQLSDAKYEQIQAYAERMLQETSNQIKSEGLLERGVGGTVANKKPSQPTLKPALRQQPTTNVLLQKSSPPESKMKVRSTATIVEPTLSERRAKVERTPPKVVEIESVVNVSKTMTTPPKVLPLQNDQHSLVPIVEPTITAKVANNGLLQSSKQAVMPSPVISTVISEKSQTKSTPKTVGRNKTSTASSQSSNRSSTNSTAACSRVSPRVERSTRATGINSRATAAAQPAKKTVLNEESNDNKTILKNSSSNKAPALQHPRAKPEKHLHKGVNVPNRHLELSRVFGYNGQTRKNLFHLNATGELLFTSGVFAVLWHLQSNSQRFYAEHDGDIYIMRVDSKSQYVATGQLVNAASSKMSLIRIWSVKSLATVAVLKGDRSLAPKITDMEFTVANYLFVVSNDPKLNISVWNWNAGKVIASASKTLDVDESVFGGTVHPVEGDIMVTYGKMHLVVWHLHQDKTMDYRTALQTHSKLSKTIHCADFLGDNSLLTGDATGHLTIWAPFEVNAVLEFAVKEVKGHEAPLTALVLTPEHLLVSADAAGAIKTWDVGGEGEFRLLNAIKLSALCGAVASVALPPAVAPVKKGFKKNGNGGDKDEGAGLMEVFVGTTENFLLRGSALQSTSYDIVFEGHIMAIRSIAFDPQEDLFYTASLDQKVCKWSTGALVWRTTIDVQAISSAVHPGGQILAIGSVNGIISILACVSGELVHHLEISAGVCIGCLAYSADGSFLVAGCQDGCLHVLPVTDDGFTYSKVSVLKGPLPILTLQWSVDTQFILTSVDDNNYQELILWDLHNTRYIRNVTNFSDNLRWHNATCSGLEDARGTWDNDRLKNVINICNHYSPSLRYIVTGDESGFVRLFSYPCLQTNAAFFEYRQGGGSVTDIKISPKETLVVDCNFEGSILLWTLKEYDGNSSNTTTKQQ